MQRFGNTSIESTDLIPLHQLSNGECEDIFKENIERLLLNAIDPSTSSKGKRKFTLKVEFKPTEKRREVDVTLSSSFNLVGKKPVKTRIMVGRRDGHVVAAEDSAIELADEPVITESGYDKAHLMTSLASLGGGALAEKWALAMEEVAYNIIDPNTNPTDKRAIIFFLEFNPSEDRSFASGQFNVTTQLAPLSGVPFSFRFSDGPENTLIVTEQRLVKED